MTQFRHISDTAGRAPLLADFATQKEFEGSRVPLKNAFTRALRTADLELRRIEPRTAEQGPLTASSGRVIEFVGVSGIGKTTLARRLQGSLGGRWYFVEHVASIQEAAFRLPPGRQAFYDRLIEAKIAAVRGSGRHLYQQLSNLSTFSTNLLRDMAIRQAPVSRGFVQHDGALHVYCDEILIAGQADPVGMETFLRDRAIVHIVARRPETVLARIRARRREAGEAKLNNYPGLDDATVLDMTLEKDRQRRILCTICEEMGLPLLRLDAEEEPETNLRRIVDFEAQLLA